MSFEIQKLEIEWLPPIMFSFDVVILLAAVLQITRIVYSKATTTTKLSILPYYSIVAYLSCEMVELLLLIYKINTFKSDSYKDDYWTSYIWVFLDTCSIIKFIQFCLFVDFQVFEWATLWFFMLYQEDLELDTLQVKKQRYRDVERQVWKYWKWAVFVLNLPFAVQIVLKWALTIYYKKYENLADFEIWDQKLQLFIFVTELVYTFSILVMTCLVAPRFVSLMNKRHKSVFETHYAILLAQVVSITLTSSVILVFVFYSAQSQLCIITEGLKYLLQASVWAETGYTNEEYCVKLFTKLLSFDSSAKGLVIVTAIEFLIGLIPITVFLLTYKPHDCFKCLGKDPNHTYSIWQQPLPKERQTEMHYKNMEELLGGTFIDEDYGTELNQSHVGWTNE